MKIAVKKEIKVQYCVGDLKNQDSQLEEESWWDEKLCTPFCLVKLCELNPSKHENHTPYMNGYGRGLQNISISEALIRAPNLT